MRSRLEQQSKHKKPTSLFCSVCRLHYLCTMIYPKNFETKIGFDEIRTLLKQRCLCQLGREMVDNMQATDDAATINEWLLHVCA